MLPEAESKTDLERGLEHEQAARSLYETFGPSETYAWGEAGKGVRDFWRAKVGHVLNAIEGESK